MQKPDTDQEEDLLLGAFDDAKVLEDSFSAQSTEEYIRDVSKRYKVISLLGEGTLKKVYLANDEYMGRKVALARIKDEGHLDDFFNEARLASKLEHPYIAPIYDMGFDESGQAFFAMKLYEGQSLYDELHRKKSEPSDITWILSTFLKVCEAVAYAHGQGILHLDIKPSNIRIDDYGEVLLCDWGISRIIGHAQILKDQNPLIPLLSRATLTGEVRGTPGFMAPEQGNKETQLDERSDIFSLGALLYDMLTGQPPNKTIDFKSSSVPTDIQAICVKTLQNYPAKRYNSVSSLMEDIINFNKGLVLSAERASIFTVLHKWAKRKKRLLATLSCNLLLIIILISIYIKNINQVNDKLEVTVQELTKEKELKKKQRLELAERHYQQAVESYSNAVTHSDYNPRTINFAVETSIKALESNPSHLNAWGMLGNLRLLRSEYDEALLAYSKAGIKYESYPKMLKEHLNDYPDHIGIESSLDLINKVHKLKNSALRNHLIFKGIHSLRKEDGLFEFSIKSLAILNNLEKLNYIYDKDSKSLNLENNKLHTIYSLKTLRLEKLILKDSLSRSSELYHLRNMPLKHLDISHSEIKHLTQLVNLEIEELYLNRSKVDKISRLKHIPSLKKINIYGIAADLSVLKKCEKLEELICSPIQAQELQKSLDKRVKITVVTN
jgi:serine/threonine protein kinase